MSRPAPKRDPHDYAINVQDGVVTRRQLASFGFDRDAVRAQIAAGRWQSQGRSVVVLHNGPPTVRQQRWVAVLGHQTAALAGLTAANEHGLHGFDEDRVHVLIPFGARPHALPGVTLHVSRRFSDADMHPGRVLPVVGIDRALVDAATWTTDRRKACGILAAGVQQRLTTAARLRPALAIADRAQHHRLLTRIVGDIEGGADSFAEIDFIPLARRAGLPPPRRQVFRLDRAGRRRWLDADFGTFTAEIDGAIHLRPLNYWRDMERQNDLLIVTGKPMLRFASVGIRLAPDDVVAQLSAAGRRFGVGQ